MAYEPLVCSSVLLVSRQYAENRCDQRGDLWMTTTIAWWCL